MGWRKTDTRRGAIWRPLCYIYNYIYYLHYNNDDSKWSYGASWVSWVREHSLWRSQRRRLHRCSLYVVHTQFRLGNEFVGGASAVAEYPEKVIVFWIKWKYTRGVDSASTVLHTLLSKEKEWRWSRFSKWLLQVVSHHFNNNNSGFGRGLDRKFWKSIRSFSSGNRMVVIARRVEVDDY